MTAIHQICKCEICGNIIEVLHEGADSLVCCGQPMKLQQENTVDAAFEKHIPIIENNFVKVGSVEHPMGPEHYIEWIEATSSSGEVCKKFLKPNEKPEVKFNFEVVSARAYCNFHGAWKN